VRVVSRKAGEPSHLEAEAAIFAVGGRATPASSTPPQRA
jgi:hypothetical protein